MQLGWKAIATVAALLACAAPSMRRAAAEDFFQGKTITIVVGFAPGGGFDLFARLLSRHIGDFIPGHPTVIVKNMPGAGTMTAVRSLATAPNDGTTIAAFHFGLIGQSRLTPGKVPMDFRKFAWLGSISQDLSVCYTSTATAGRGAAFRKTGSSTGASIRSFARPNSSRPTCPRTFPT
jgi:tripartite-type tricarboxylate transporter receptor subunit TctC